MIRTVSQHLIALAMKRFPRLMHHRTNREDALQTLALVELAARRKDVETVALQSLAWLEYELGIAPAPPLCPRPEFKRADETARIYRQDLTAAERAVLFTDAAA